MIPKNFNAVRTNGWSRWSGTGRRAFRSPSQSQTALAELYKTDRGARVLNIIAWAVLLPDPHRSWFSEKLKANFPRLSTFNSESENEYLIQMKEYLSTVGRPISLFLANPGLPEHLGDPVYEKISPEYFSKLSEYTIQVYDVPQEFDLLEQVIGDVGYLSMAPGSSLWITCGTGLYDKGDVPLDSSGFSSFVGSREAWCWGDRISIFGSALENA